jgi:hypothetical protein
MTNEPRNSFPMENKIHRPSVRSARRISRISLCLAVATAGAFLVLAGCRKKAPVAVAPSQPDAQSQAQPAPPVQSQPGQVAPSMAQADGQPNLGALDHAVLRWMMRNRRPPANFEDFAATAGVTIPPAPAGKKYFLGKDMRISLVDR